ncbi:Eco57I restriction-modification methylase domain-containing protein [Hymenobacter sp. 15J16-1T3B]|uniref:Eco57I restriction-modification methylase domain-containing protein n=1 Tax=Hymenobacter sp. 15J16-1T3B TaxID=2886941 RepID=UPI001D11F0ED|nr:Eco57I restriction-modification methylase domain-containing protein [Hymenobacter sp. 15J16-1T3B]MCC3158657.1 Eco57I restriction-modification methylase domain-containing protein [Hymenobacter sp. 15J16-1T3B]
MSKLDFRTALARPYDRVSFVHDVLRPVFGGVGRLRVFSRDESAGTLTAADQRLVQTAVQYGELTLDDGTEVRCLEVRLQHQVRPEQSRIGIQQLVRRLLTAGQAALVNFVPAANEAGTQPWRLTLVARDTVLRDEQLQEHTTHARRYTYLLGPGQAVRTPNTRLQQLVAATDLSLETLVKAFEVEVLSKEFFKEYKQHYVRFSEALAKSNFKKSVFNGDEKAIRDFAKKLLGRLVFLYFVQKKGWLGASSTEYADGDPDFVMQLFIASGANDTFYPVWLSKLFFETLNERRTNDKFVMPDKQEVHVPFLNGGLFDRSAYDGATLTLPAILFAHPTHGDDPNKRGYLDFLNSYNFTIYEDSPDDQTVAVDPEMLGHIFENLLEENRAKGAIYTPRAIVHFMCQQSLVRYLENEIGIQYGAQIRQLIIDKRVERLSPDLLRDIDEALSRVKVCDPAIGSGAFPMGLLQEIFAVQELIHYEQGLKTWSPARVKARIIQQSIYGVDVDAGAVDIARLRFWLALVVDETQPRELPNLDYKIMQGNSLLESFEGIALDNLTGTADDEPSFAKSTQLLLGQEFSHTAQGTLVFSAAKQQELEQMMHEFYEVTDPVQKRKKRDQINTLIEKQLKEYLTKKKTSLDKRIKAEETELRAHFGPQFATVIKPKSAQGKKYALLQAERTAWEAKIDRLLAFQKGTDRPFFLWHTYFREVFTGPNPGFDIVVANPPYIRVQGVKSTQDREKEQYEATYRGVAEGAYDLANLFVVLALRLGNQRCTNCFIFPHKFFNSDAGTGIRELLLNGSNELKLGGQHVHKVAHFGANQIFNEADTYVCIALFSPEPATQGFRIQKFALGEDYHALMNDESRYRLVPYERLQRASRLYGSNQWIFFREAEEYDLFEEIYSSRRRFVDIFEDIFQGIATSNDKLYILEVTEENHLYYWGKNGLSDRIWQVEKTFFKPMLKGRDVQRYEPLATQAYVFFPYIVKSDEPEVVPLADIKTAYPYTYEYVVKQSDMFKARESGKAGKMPHWHSYIYPKNIVKFERKQRRLSNMEICATHPNVTINDGTFYHNTKVYSWVKKADVEESYEYLLALANSQLMWWFLKNTGDTLQGDARTLKTNYLYPFPVPVAAVSERDALATLAVYLLWLGDANNPAVSKLVSNAAVAQYLRQVVDVAVCELYFQDHMNTQEIDVLRFLEKEVTSLPNGSALEQAATIGKVYAAWQEPNSPVRNRLKVARSNSPDKLAYILQPALPKTDY